MGGGAAGSAGLVPVADSAEGVEAAGGADVAALSPGAALRPAAGANEEVIAVSSAGTAPPGGSAGIPGAARALLHRRAAGQALRLREDRDAAGDARRLAAIAGPDSRMSRPTATR